MGEPASTSPLTPARRRAELAESAAALLANLSEPVLLARPSDGRVEWANEPAAQMLFGRTEARGLLLPGALHGQVFFSLTKEAMESGRDATVKMRINSLLNGEVQAADCEITATAVGGADGLCRIMIRRQQGITVDVDSWRRALREARTPLSVIIGYAENLIEGEITDPVSTRQALLALLRHTRRLQQILETAAC